MQKELSAIALVFLLSSILTSTLSIQSVKAQANTWTVDDDGLADFRIIQEAVNTASPGATIIVRAGTYIENVVVSKSLTIKSESGAEVTIIQGANYNIPLFSVTTSIVNISGFTLRKTTVGAYLSEVWFCRISNNIISDNGDGIRILNSNRNNITENKIYNNGFSIYLQNSFSNEISNNVISHSRYHGFYLGGSNNEIKNNIFANEGLEIYGAYSNILYLNDFVDIVIIAYGTVAYPCVNTWNSPEEITYTYNGKTFTNYLGNYWSDYTGSDTNEDGIGDTPYSIDVDKDDYPLIKPFENYLILIPLPENRPPMALFTYTPKEPIVSETITFNASTSYDSDGYIVSYQWSFGDGDIAYGETVTHTYPDTGDYSATLIVTDDYGATGSISVMIKVKRVWAFAIITDPHIGYCTPDYGTEGWGDSGGANYDITYRLERVMERIKELNRDGNNDYYIRFVVVLGDIADSAEYSELQKAIEILGRLNEDGIPYIPIIGNHDVWPYTQRSTPSFHRVRIAAEEAPSGSGLYFENLFWDKSVNKENINLIKTLFGSSWRKEEPNTLYLENYAFSYKGIRFISLDCVTRNHFMWPFAGVGSDADLFAETSIWLADNLREDEPAVIFSHHPILADYTAAFSLEELWTMEEIIRLSRSSVLATFAGHIHENTACVNAININVVITEAVFEETEDIIRVVKVQDRTIDYSTLEGIPRDEYVDPGPERWVAATLGSPGELRVYDSQGRVTGLVNGALKNEIPNTVYFESLVVISNPVDFYRYEVVGTDEGPYRLTIANATEEAIALFTGTEIPMLTNTVHQYVIDWGAVSQGKEGVILQVDSDGDGIFETCLTADSELTHDEFMLQTATIIDFEPDTLNLRSNGSVVTVYIELPEGYDVSRIDVSTIRLNKTVPALAKPTGIGDYDGDGILDLMVKFDRASVIALFAGKTVPGKYVIEVTGTWMGIPLRGKDTIDTV